MTGLPTYRAMLALVVLLLAAGAARADQLVTDLSEHQIAIRSNFTGTQILLFGAVEARTPGARALNRDVVVVVQGPNAPAMVRRKERVGGIWVNHDSVTYPDVPGYYAIASTRPLEVTAPAETLKALRIGIDSIDPGPAEARAIDGTAQVLMPEQETAFWKALIRNRQRERLFANVPGGVTFLGQTLFRATVDIPANVPVGLYTAKVYLFQDGVVVDTISSPLYIDKRGIERLIYRMAHSDPILYGLLAVLGAALAGWLASAIMGRR
ncbi:TIGR02186 family protein [uncultured Parvibaculum sp.]|uniref:TIGR02186 family protein n=1 Tax=uncultured Parvibaculum sp. TaxID=291828 RepID=UPI0030DAFF27|tara:strand:+ start:77861 stop:78661 length:801 start_codon:yes stop_codon:yes gene_type:complete